MIAATRPGYHVQPSNLSIKGFPDYMPKGQRWKISSEADLRWSFLL